MASVQIESAFVESWNRNDEQHPAWGMKTAEPHSKKDESGKYQTIARTFRTVKVSRDSGIDLTRFKKGDRVKVKGKEITETREFEGKKHYDIVVWADSVELAGERQSATAQPAPTGPIEEPWAVAPAGGYADETPF